MNSWAKLCVTGLALGALSFITLIVAISTPGLALIYVTIVLSVVGGPLFFVGLIGYLVTRTSPGRPPPSTPPIPPPSPD